MNSPSSGDHGSGNGGFEQTLAQLETLVSRLESGELPLDEALRLFEQGVRLTRECQTALSAAQQKVQILLQQGERVTVEEFHVETVTPLPGEDS